MKSKTAEIITTVASWRDRGISREKAILTLGMWFHYVSIDDAAKTFGHVPDRSVNGAAEAIVNAMYDRKERRAA